MINIKPVIGIIEWPYIDKDGDYIFEVSNSIVDKINKTGGIPIGIFPTLVDDFIIKNLCDIDNFSIDNLKDLKDILLKCNGIIKPGARKIYKYERIIYNYCVDYNIPFLGICAGMQLMSNYKNSCNMKKNNNSLHNSNMKYCHYVNILKNTLLYDLLKKDRILVNSKHNYHVSNKGLMDVCCYSDDGIIEGIYNKNMDFHIGLQWHPELLDDENSMILFENLIENAKKLKK